MEESIEKKTKTKYGQKVRVACFSCKFECGMGPQRRCANKQSKYYGQDKDRESWCDEWEMKDGLSNAGKGDGRVKKISYLQRRLDYVCGGSEDKALLEQLEMEKQANLIYENL